MQRRKFIVAGTTALAGATLGMPLTWANAAVLGPSAPAKSPFNQAMFRGLINQNFNAYESNRGTTLQLIDVKDNGSSAKHEQFTLTFVGREATPLKSGTYDMDSSNMGMIRLYLEATGKGEQGLYYRAHFSLLG